MDGLLNVYKERGFTSHDVVAKLRGILKQKKIGHTGTLDPEAEGVLPVCLGKATKVCGLLTAKDKTYRAVLLLGVETDTQDTGGRILSQKEIKAGEEEVRKAVMGFVGGYDQIPPMYSALKVDGKKLYELARQGKEVERKARRVTIHEIVIEKVELPRVTMTVTCSKGTYIRTLCHDIGQMLGCGGAMESLLRVQAAGFRLEDAVCLTELQQLKEDGKLDSVIQPVDEVFLAYPALTVEDGAEKMLKNGNPLFAAHLKKLSEEHYRQPVRIYDSAGKFAAIYRYSTEKKCFRPEKMFLED